MVAVIGPSGSGKSSVVFAGLIPQLRAEGNWLIDSFRPQNQPFYGLASALVRLLKPGLDEIQQIKRSAELGTDLMQGKLTLLQVTSNILERNFGKRMLLVVDQFEEIYTLCSDEEQYQFIGILLDAINQDNLTLVLTLRADFYGYVLSNRRLRDALQQFTPQLLSSMNREELQFVIEKPLERLSVSLEAKLIQRILDDVGREPGNLPLLEFALTRLWKKKQNRKLTHSTYDEIGGVKQALANHAEEIYSQLSETQQK
ncbi:MAG: ATP-binding protein [Oscillatoriales cyanobacterium C42_A2020_001]|nr:ATP-binding protein [Leptolyngbyaceae cyanobacterium C42_A2020_001]